MSLNDTLEAVSTSARRLKEELHRSGQGAQFIVEAWRGGRPVAVVATEANRDLMLDVCALCAAGFGADTLATTVDTYLAVDPINPRTKRPWKPGELTLAAERQKTDHTEVATEAIVTTVHNRADDLVVQVQRYNTTESGIEWFPDLEIPEEAVPGGYVIDQIDSIMKRPTVDQVLGWEGVTVQGEHARAVADFAAIKRIRRTVRARGTIAVYAEPGSTRARFFEHRMSGQVWWHS